jgi:hypothetical protein
MEDPFAFEDVAGAFAALHNASSERLYDRLVRGEQPLAAAAELARRGDLRAHRAMVGCAAFLTPEEVPVLALCGDAGADALAFVALATWLPLPLRVAAVSSMGTASPTAAVFAALQELSQGAQRPPQAQAVSALADVSARVSNAAREECTRLRDVARQVREGHGSVIRRQGFQREVAAGTLHPLVGVLLVDEGEFLAGMLPPIADGAREALVTPLLGVLRGTHEDRRQRCLGFLQRRWRDVAVAALSCAARTVSKQREGALAAVRALAAMGAHDDLVYAVGSTSGAVRMSALNELLKVVERNGEYDRDMAEHGLVRAQTDHDAGVRKRATEVSAKLRSSK